MNQQISMNPIFLSCLTDTNKYVLLIWFFRHVFLPGHFCRETFFFWESIHYWKILKKKHYMSLYTELICSAILFQLNLFDFEKNTKLQIFVKADFTCCLLYYKRIRGLKQKTSFFLRIMYKEEFRFVLLLLLIQSRFIYAD